MDKTSALYLAASRYTVGCTGKSTPDCEWYEGIKADAEKELKEIAIAEMLNIEKGVAIHDYIEKQINDKQYIIIFVEGGVMNSVVSTNPNISVILADKDNVETKEDEIAYSLLVSLSESDDYIEIY